MPPLVPFFWFPFLFSLLPSPQCQSQAHFAGASNTDSLTNTSGFIQDCRDTALLPLTPELLYCDCLRAEDRADDQAVVSFGDAFELLCITTGWHRDCRSESNPHEVK